MKLTELAFGLFFPSAPRRAIVLRPVGSIPLAASLLSLLKPDGLGKKTHTKVDNVNIALGIQPCASCDPSPSSAFLHSLPFSAYCSLDNMKPDGRSIKDTHQC